MGMKLNVENLTFSYDNVKNILEGISFIYESPDVLCILGPNGTGKSTLLKCIVNAL